MKILEEENLPDYFISAMTSNFYTGYVRDSFCSTTELLSDPFLYGLKKHIKSEGIEIEKTIADLYWSVDGQAKHMVLERMAKLYPVIVEQTMTHSFDGDIVSGTLDVLDPREGGSIADMKNVTLSAFKRGLDDYKESWTKQLNVYRYLTNKSTGMLVEKLYVLMRLSEWKSYMDMSPYKRIDLDVWPLDKAKSFIKGEIEKRKDILENFDPLAGCSPDNRWRKEDEWSFQKVAGKPSASTGYKRATKLFDNEAEAQAALEEVRTIDRKKYEVEKREGEDTKCKDFCFYKDYCKASIYNGGQR